MEGIKVGIGRINPDMQSLQELIDAFNNEGIQERFIYIDSCFANATLTETRENYQRAKAIVRAGDTVYLNDLRCLGRTVKEIEREWRYYIEVGCDIVVLNMPVLDTRISGEYTHRGNIVSEVFLSVFQWISQNEFEERKRRQREGIEAAKRAGKYKGRKPIEVNVEDFKRLYFEVERGERTNKYVMEKLGLTRSTYYKLVEELKKKMGRFAE